MFIVESYEHIHKIKNLYLSAKINVKTFGVNLSNLCTHPMLHTLTSHTLTPHTQMLSHTHFALLV